MTLEELAKWLDEMASWVGETPEGCPGWMRDGNRMVFTRTKAAAAACRELDAQRGRGGYSTVRIGDLWDATDAALAECDK